MIQVRDPLAAREARSTPTHTAPGSIGSAHSRTASTAVPSAARRSSPKTGEQLINIPFDQRDGNNGNLPLVDPESRSDDGPADIVTLLPERPHQVLDGSAGQRQPHADTHRPSRCSPPTTARRRARASTTPPSTTTSSTARANNTIFIDQNFAAETLADGLLGDMSIGYLISQGYSEVVQGLLGSKLHRRAASAPRRLPDRVVDP